MVAKEQLCGREGATLVAKEQALATSGPKSLKGQWARGYLMQFITVGLNVVLYHKCEQFGAVCCQSYTDPTLPVSSIYVGGDEAATPREAQAHAS